MSRSLRLQKIWKDQWFLSLQPIHKLVIEFVRAHCDSCGVWEFDRSEIEMKVGFGNITPAWVHAQIRGIEFATQELAEEDAEARNLDPKKVRPKELPKWSNIIAAINKRPPDFEGQIVPQIEIIGENKWWFVRFIEQQFGQKAWGRRPASLKLLESPNKQQGAAIRALRRNGLMARFRQYYPNAVIVESQAAAKADGAILEAGQQNGSQFPSLADILSAPEGGRMPPTERRVFWMEHDQRHWQGIENWRIVLGIEEKLWAIKFDYNQVTGQSWPETEREKALALEFIMDRLAGENSNRQEIGGQMRLPADAMARVKVLLRAKEMIEKK